MNITKTQIDDLNATLKVELTKEDYENRVTNALKDYQKKVVIDGFRKGKVPFGVVKKMYGKAVLVDELNKLINEGLTNYLQENKLDILGEPLPNESEHPDLDLEGENFEFIYDIAVSPVMNVKMSKREKVPYYSIKIDDEMINKQVEGICKNHGELKVVDVVEGTEYLKTLSELGFGVSVTPQELLMDKIDLIEYDEEIKTNQKNKKKTNKK